MSVAALSIASPIATPRDPAPISEKNKLIRSVALRSLWELAISLILGTASSLFTVTPLGTTAIFRAILIQTVFNTLFRYLGALAVSKALQDNNQEKAHRIEENCSYLCMTLFAYLTAYNGQLLMHEMGHALAAHMVYLSPRPSITISPFWDAMTEFTKGPLTAFGKKLGSRGALCFVTAMGPILALSVSGIGLAVGLAVKGKFPELGTYFTSVCRGDFYSHAFYAISALQTNSNNLSHDFKRLATFGLHPLAAAVSILAIPILITAAF